MNLPADFRVDTGRLASCFNRTTATYKFYWMLALIAEAEQARENHGRIEKRALFARMVAEAWYTVNYFKVSFGFADKLQRAIDEIRGVEGLDLALSSEAIHQRLMQSEKPETRAILNHFDANVPHKFLSPWLGSGSRSDVYALSQHGFNAPPYALYSDHVLLQPGWLEYFQRYAGILRDFCRWNLTLFLQARNPNVPDIPHKLERPERRGSLTRHKKDFWDVVIRERGGVECIYTGKRLETGEYDVEHFIPFQFVAHDLMWNLIPADPSFNSHKRDKLPPLDRYFDKFYDLQHEAVDIVQQVKPRSRFLEDYLQIFQTTEPGREQYRDTVAPLIQIAARNGFQFLSP